MERPILPESPDSMAKDEKSDAMRLFYDESLVCAFKVLLQKHIEPVFRALAFQESSAAGALICCRHLSEIGEAHAMASLVALEDQWNDSPLVKRDGSPPYPITLQRSNTTYEWP